MGDNTIPSAVPQTIIPSEHHNALRTALIEDLVPRNAGAAPETLVGNLGTSSYRWALGYIQQIFIGTAAQNISLEGNGSNLDLKVGGNVRAEFFQSIELLPPGIIVPYSGIVNVEGWLLCNGGEYSRTTYARLYAAIADIYGEGNGSSTFNVPDLRGRFLRGVDNGAGNDPDAAGRTAMNTGGNTGDNVGSLQGDEIKEHNHGVVSQIEGVFPTRTPGGTFRGYYGGDSAFTAYYDSQLNNDDFGGNETRPKNVNVNFLIKT